MEDNQYKTTPDPEFATIKEEIAETISQLQKNRYNSLVAPAPQKASLSSDMGTCAEGLMPDQIIQDLLNIKEILSDEYGPLFDNGDYDITVIPAGKTCVAAVAEAHRHDEAYLSYYASYAARLEGVEFAKFKQNNEEAVKKASDLMLKISNEASAGKSTASYEGKEIPLTFENAFTATVRVGFDNPQKALSALEKYTDEQIVFAVEQEFNNTIELPVQTGALLGYRFGRMIANNSPAISDATELASFGR